MTIGIGGSNAETELTRLVNTRSESIPIEQTEYCTRLGKIQDLLKENNIDAIYLDASTSLRYFTGLSCYRSERLHGAIITASGDLTYICPAFEEQKTRGALVIDGDFLLWDEHESPTEAIVKRVLKQAGKPGFTLAIDDMTPFFIANRLQSIATGVKIVNGESMIQQCRQTKSPTELALLTQAKTITLKVQQAAARILREGISTAEVKDFLNQAHIASGMDGASTFNIVLFGEATAYPHGVSYQQNLREGDMVLIDTGSTLHGYNSDITRCYVFGEPNARQREIWALEHDAQAAAFSAAQLGVPCSALDDAARAVIEAAGYGPGYQTPGIPHRTGHGVGLDIHEHPYIVRGNNAPLVPGMCFSIEPMICSYGEFGVRLEDHAFISEEGPQWFTEPSHSIDKPFWGVGGN